MLFEKQENQSAKFYIYIDIQAIKSERWLLKVIKLTDVKFLPF